VRWLAGHLAVLPFSESRDDRREVVVRRRKIGMRGRKKQKEKASRKVTTLSHGSQTTQKPAPGPALEQSVSPRSISPKHPIGQVANKLFTRAQPSIKQFRCRSRQNIKQSSPHRRPPSLKAGTCRQQGKHVSHCSPLARPLVSTDRCPKSRIPYD